MAVPKKRTSKQRKRKRRTHLKAAVPVVVPCPKCGDPVRPHHVCRACGYYGDRVVLEPRPIDV